VGELTFALSRQAVALDLDIQLAVEHLERPVEFWYPTPLHPELYTLHPKQSEP